MADESNLGHAFRVHITTADGETATSNKRMLVRRVSEDETDADDGENQDEGADEGSGDSPSPSDNPTPSM